MHNWFFFCEMGANYIHKRFQFQLILKQHEDVDIKNIHYYINIQYHLNFQKIHILYGTRY